LQGFGTTDEVATMSSLAEKLRTFGLTLLEIDGHNPADICNALLSTRTGCPHAVVAHTTKGHGVSFMEDKMEWHYLPMTQEQYAKAVQEVEASCAMSSVTA
jgi:transketolase